MQGYLLMMANKVLKGEIGCNIKVYVDDILVKQAKQEDHVTDLSQVIYTYTHTQR